MPDDELFQGGQGRSAEEVEAAAWIGGLALAALVLILAAAWVIRWWVGG